MPKLTMTPELIEREEKPADIEESGKTLQREEMLKRVRENAQIDEFLKEEKETEKLMSDPSLVQQPLINAQCMNAIHDMPESAAFKLLHGGLLGDRPPITLCKYCAKLMKLIPLEEEEEESITPGTKGKTYTKESPSESPTPSGKGKVYTREELMKGKKSTTQHVFKKLTNIANALDAKKLYKEAGVIDIVLKNINNEGLK